MKIKGYRESTNVEDRRGEYADKIAVDKVNRGLEYNPKGSASSFMPDFRDLKVMKTRKTDPADALARTGGIKPPGDAFRGFDHNYPMDGAAPAGSWDTGGIISEGYRPQWKTNDQELLEMADLPSKKRK